MGRPRTPIEDRFWPKVERRGPDECWPWRAARTRGGYGAFQLPTGSGPGRMTNAHRVAWELANGEAAGTRHVLHTCDNRLCCNPAHLYAGTPGDNVRDMIERDRARYVAGEEHGMAKLTAEQVRAIRQDPRDSAVLAVEYGVSERHIRKIKGRSTWRREEDG